MQQYRKNLGKVSLTAEGIWNIKSKYDVLSIVYDEHTQHGFISKQPVPIGVDLYNSKYWMPLNVSGYVDSNIIILNKKTFDASIESYTLEEAIKSIAPVGRKPGCILGFYNSNANRLDIGGRWEIWQFNSTTISEWEDLSNWQNIYYNYNKFVGWYRNEEQLKINNPYPEVGCYAYVGNVLNKSVVYRCEIKHKWAETVQRGWDYVKVMIDGTVTVGENGNWHNNGEDTGIPANVKGDPGISPFIRYNTIKNKLEYSYDKNVWYECSDYISTWFRWNATSGDTQVNKVGRIQISRDKVNWTNLSGDIINNLHISRYIGVDETLPTSGIAEGTIYAKGPYYAEGDTLNNNPIYRLWVYGWKGDTLAWQDNGEFTSIVAGVVQETGNSETEVMSQKAVSEKLSELATSVMKENIQIDGISNYIVYGYLWNTLGEKVPYDKHRCLSEIINVNNTKGYYDIPNSTVYVRCFDDFMNYIGNANINKVEQSITLQTGTKKVGIYWTVKSEDIEGPYIDSYIVFGINAKTIIENKNNIKEKIDKGYINLFNLNDPNLVEGYLQNDGTIVDNSMYLTTNYIPCKKGQVFYPATDGEHQSWRFVSFYDINKFHLERLDEPTYVEVTNDNAAYVRFSVWKEDEKTQISTINTYWHPYTPIGKYMQVYECRRINKNEVDYLKELVSIPVKNLKKEFENLIYISDSFVDNEYFNTSDGKIFSNTNYGRSDYLSVNPNITYKIKGFYCGYCIAFDENKKYLRQVDIVENILTLSEDVKYIGINYQKQFQPNDYLNKGIIFDVKSLLFNQDKYETVSNILSGKKWCVVGDSFSQYSDEVFTSGDYVGQNVTYKYLIAERNNMTIYDYTMGGRTMAYPNDHTFDNAFANPSLYQSIPEDADYITIMLGINDGSHYAGYSPDGESTQGYISLGNIDSVDTGSFYGAWNVVLDWIFTNRPYAHVGIIITNGMGDKDGNANEKQRQLYQAILDIVKKWNVPHINLNGGDGKTPMMQRGIYPEGTPASLIISKWNAFAVDPINLNGHTNAKGHRYESVFIEDFLRSI